MNLIQIFLVLVFGISLMSCASTQKTVKYRNSELSNFNPAPRSMSPPTAVSEDPVIDPTHVRSQADYHFALGEALSLDGESERAIEEFKLATVYDAESAEIRLRLGNEYLRQGLLTESVEQAELALKLDSESVDVHLFLGGLYSALKMYKQAHEQYQFVAHKEPTNNEVPLYLGALYVEQEKFDEAEAQFLHAAKMKGNERAYLAHYYIGKMRASQGEANLQRAEKAFVKSLQLKPDFDEGVLALSDLYTSKGLKAKSIKLLESYQEQFGPQKSIAFQLSQMYLDAENYTKAYKHLQVLESFEPKNLNVKVKMALILIEQKTYDSAIEKLEEIIVMSPGSDKIRFYLAAVYEETGRADLAIENFKKIESSSTYFADAVVHASYLYRKKTDLKSAAELLKVSIAARDDIPQFYAFYASILDEQKEYKRGVGMLEAALQKFPDNTQLRFYLGSMYDRLGKTEETISEMRKVVALEANHVQALNYLAYTFAEQSKNLEEAESLARQAMDIQPNDAFILDTLGWVLFKQGRVEDSIQYLEAAYRLKPDESIIAEHLGDAYYVFELAAKAKEMYLKAVSVESDESKVSKLRAKIVSLDSRLQSDRTPASAFGK
ncbi:MAG: tetratricopeptide repeat protein [Bdellovibrionales bacterium]|nr:tetratricopeptide repeat protein [Bdellovibrionales bacterium]